MKQLTDIDVFNDNAPEILKDLATRIAVKGTEHYGIDEQTATNLGIEVALDISKNWRGAQIYIPSDDPIRVRQRDLEMYEKFTGFNHLELAKEYGVSVIWVYAIVKKVRKQIQDKQQPQLPFNQSKT